tara:strand:+ start:423 stop:824 length:402 start_codon:yes stop_codon:yes gene_type:complete
MPYYISDCFSNNCGLCYNCNKNNTEIKKNRFPNDIQIPKLSKAYDMDLFSQNNIHQLSKDYNLKLKNIKYNPSTKTKYNMKYNLNYSNDICDNIQCKCIYLNANDKLKDYYQKLPTYKRQDDNCKLCIICIDS